MPIYEFFCPGNNKIYSFLARSLGYSGKVPRCPDDAKLPMEIQRQALGRLAYLAFLEMRLLGRESNPEQVADLAEAIHNLPLMMSHLGFSMSCQRASFARYHEKHGVREGFDYAAELDKIAQMKG